MLKFPKVEQKHDKIFLNKNFFKNRTELLAYDQGHRGANFPGWVWPKKHFCERESPKTIFRDFAGTKIRDKMAKKGHFLAVFWPYIEK